MNLENKIMVISHRDRWIYLANPKCASSSLNYILKKQEDVVLHTSSGRINHMSYVDCKQLLANKGLNIDDYFVFSFVRNPWDKVVSMYKWLSRHKKERTGHPIISLLNYYIDKYNISEFSFYNFITKLIDTKLLWVTLACDYMLFENGQNKLSFIGRVENFKEDFDIICDKIGITRQELPHVNKTKHKHYTEYYDDETKQIVAEKYAKDIEYFNYKFGE